MIIRWRAPGAGMGTVDLRSLDGDQVVIHYGGALKSVDAYTFANSLIAFSDTARSISGAISHAPRIEVRVEALGEGSFRAIVKRVPSGITDFFKRGAENLLWAYLAFAIIERIHGPPDQSAIQVSDDYVIITRGKDRIIVPRAVYDGYPKIKADPKVQENITKTFEVIEEDDAVENFGITRRVDDVDPLLQVNRQDFPRLVERPVAISNAIDDISRKERMVPARLLILKLWLKPSVTRKWSFEWNGVPISAPIKDQEFLGKLERRDYLIGSGDALDVELRYFQYFDSGLNIFVNDPTTFEVAKVTGVIQRESQQDLLR